jgi:hypothetical protein
MNWPETIIDNIVTHLFDTNESSDLSNWQKLQACVEEDLKQRAEAWKSEHKFLTALEYREKYTLSNKELHEAEKLGFLKTINDIPRPFSLALRLLYPDRNLTPKQLQKVRDVIYLSTSKAAAYMGISTSAFRRLGIEPSVPPWNQNGQYSGNFYRLSDILAWKDVAVSKSKPSANQQKSWKDLNERQQTYLLIIYTEEKRKEPYYSSYASMGDPKRKGSEWRWCEHDSGLDAVIDKTGMLDQGTGSTYESLERRELIERRHRRVHTMLGWVNLLDVRLTRKGRALAKAFEQN